MVLVRYFVSLKVRLCPRVVRIVTPAADRARRGILRDLTAGESRVEDLANTGCEVSAILEVLRDCGEIARVVAPVW